MAIIKSIDELKKYDLIVMVGLPRSGKSTFCKQYLPEYVRINQDNIRLALYEKDYYAPLEPYVKAIHDTMLKTLLLDDTNRIVIDNTSIVSRYRHLYIKIAEQYNKSIAFVEMNTPVDICIGRAKMSSNPNLVSVIQNMNEIYENITESEEGNIFIL